MGGHVALADARVSDRDQQRMVVQLERIVIVLFAIMVLLALLVGVALAS